MICHIINNTYGTITCTTSKLLYTFKKTQSKFESLNMHSLILTLVFVNITLLNASQDVGVAWS